MKPNRVPLLMRQSRDRTSGSDVTTTGDRRQETSQQRQQSATTQDLTYEVTGEQLKQGIPSPPRRSETESPVDTIFGPF